MMLDPDVLTADQSERATMLTAFRVGGCQNYSLPNYRVYRSEIRNVLGFLKEEGYRVHARRCRGVLGWGAGVIIWCDPPGGR